MTTPVLLLSNKTVRIFAILLSLAGPMGLALFCPNTAWAYPDFIGYGYSSCLTCHTNGLGGGPINDYGRGLWAAEIASRSFYPKEWKLEQISQGSGFAGDPEKLPWWIRPHIKYRGILVQRNPGSQAAVQKYYNMQLDMGATLYLDQDQRYAFLFTLGYIPNAETVQSGSVNRILPRDYYARILLGETFWVYLGKMEKAYGIRNVDHTSFNRAPQELTQNSQSHGATLHLLRDQFEIAANFFVGDPASATPLAEQKGLALWSEFEVQPRQRLGFSFLRSTSQTEKAITLGGAHWRQALTKGSAIMFEYGLIQKIDKPLGLSSNGSYTFVESFIELTGGYNLLVNLERYNGDSAANSPEQWKYGLGLVMFPINRLELRLGAQHFRQVSSDEASPDSWALQGQLRVSL